MMYEHDHIYLMETNEEYSDLYHAIEALVARQDYRYPNDAARLHISKKSIKSLVDDIDLYTPNPKWSLESTHNLLMAAAHMFLKVSDIHIRLTCIECNDRISLDEPMTMVLEYDKGAFDKIRPQRLFVVCNRCNEIKENE